MREAAYTGLVRSILEYGSSVWDPHYEGLIDDLKKMQKRVDCSTAHVSDLKIQ